MIRISHLTLARGTKRLLDDASLTVHAGKRVGIVGANGTGKSSLLALLRREIDADAGDVSIPPSWTLAHVAQEVAPTARAAIDFAIDGDVELRAIERELAALQAAGASADGEALAEAHQRYDSAGGYAARSRAAALLSGLGVAESRQNDAVSTFSGGWRMRLNLAQALMRRSDLLLLDEPTNHLDLDAVLWLEEWLLRYRGTLLLVTHDRDILDRVATDIVHVDAQKLRTYAGNYAQFEVERAAALAAQDAARARQEREVAHLRAFVDRFRAKATKAKQAQSRVKALERMEMIAAAHADTPFSFAFAPCATHARQLVALEHANIGHGARATVEPIVRDVTWSILAGSRIGLLGANGAGKSTLLAGIAGRLPLASGSRHAAQELRVGYFAQHQLEALRVDESALWHVRAIDPSAREQELRDFLGGFDFRGDRVSSPVAEFSGGEKARLTLALIVRAKPNLLLLDEPTNHLDIEMREALTEALQDYDGALVVVGHDRHLLRATADELWLVDDGTLAPFDGDLDDYREWVLSRRGVDSPPALDANAAGSARKAQRRLEAEARQRRSARRKPLVEAIGRAERDIETLAADKRALDEWLATPDAYSEAQKPRLVESLARQGDLAWQLARAEARWLELSEALDELPDESL